MEGWIKLFKKLQAKSYYKKDSEAVHLWLHILFSASHLRREETLGGKVVICEAGQFTTGRKQLSQLTGISESKVERLLQKFEKIEQQIEQRKTTTNRMITVLNWEEYQLVEQQTNNERTTSEQRANTLLDINKNIINISMPENPAIDLKLFPPEEMKPKTEEPFYLTKKRRKLSGKRLDTFNIFWQKFDYKNGKTQAADAWLDIPVLTPTICEKIYLAAEAEAKARPKLEAAGKTPIWPQGWISGRRWEDERYFKQVTTKKQNSW